ncbi:sensor histidine kinase [Acutalibacter sp.]|uniref:sensor histidine kinase n=1 Tax=Acutalibacter sp. TaxID=1918636 RepID=UPI0025C397DB|nr:HAMP domain-containing sensor histidine kinase [Acutalibacter sp.]
MKRKITKILQLLMLLTAGFAACSAIYFLVDDVFDGSFVNWVEANLLEVEYYYNSHGESVVDMRIAWYRLKPILLGAFTAGTLILLTVSFTASHITARQREKRCITDISQRLRAYMEGKRDAVEVFPKEQAEIAVQLSDIKSALLENQRRLKEETTRKNDLIAYLAHDLKTPLTSVIGYLSLLDEAADMPQEQRAKYTRITLDKAYRLEKMINEFFDITRYNLQQIAIQKEPVDLYYLLVQLTDELLPVLEKNKNTVSLQADESLTVQGDPDKLARVFGNLLKNAAAYSYPGTEIGILAEETESHITVRFKNQGKTIPAEKLNSIFEKFYRLDEARSSGTGGAGLGLAIAKEIAALHGGDISAQSQAGTVTFTITLPKGN